MSMKAPLDGIRILTFEQYGSGPFGSMYLANLGAEVIKIEQPQTAGDASRHVGPYMLGEADSQYFQSFNLNKKSVCLDLSLPADRSAFQRLVADSDAVMNNLRGDKAKMLGLDFQSLKAIKPAIVCLHISAYGRDNSRGNWPGYDFLMQAEAGLMSLTGEPDGPPCRIGVSIVDYMAGIVGAFGLVSCLLKARQSGEGCDVDTSLFDVALAQLAYSATWFLNEGANPVRLERGAHQALVPVQSFKTADGPIFVMCMSQGFWEELAEAMGREDLNADSRFATQAARRANRMVLTQVLDGEFSKRTTSEWLAILSGRVPAAPINDVAQAFSNPFLAEIGIVQSAPHPRRPDFRVLANPIKLNGARANQRVCSALGADTQRVVGTRIAKTTGEFS